MLYFLWLECSMIHSNFDLINYCYKIEKEYGGIRFGEVSSYRRNSS